MQRWQRWSAAVLLVWTLSFCILLYRHEQLAAHGAAAEAAAKTAPHSRLTSLAVATVWAARLAAQREAKAKAEQVAAKHLCAGGGCSQGDSEGTATGSTSSGGPELTQLAGSSPAASEGTTLEPPERRSEATGPRGLPPLALNVTEDMAPGKLGEGSKHLVFLRIQKTAGTTLERILGQACPKLGWQCDSNWHIDWNLVVQRHAGQRCLTFLRHPVDRVYSEYLFLAQHSHKPPPEGMPQWDYTPTQAEQLQLQLKTVEAFVSMPDNPANNRMSRYLLGFRRPYIFLCLEQCEAWWNDYLEGHDVKRMADADARASAPEVGTAPGAALRLAEEAGVAQAELLRLLRGRLQRLDYGISDCFEASVRLLARTFGWDIQAAEPMARMHFRAGGKNVVANRTRLHRRELSASAVEAIERHKALDMQLFEMASRLFMQRLEEHGLSAADGQCQLE